MNNKKIYEDYVKNTGSTLVGNYQLIRSNLGVNGSILRVAEQVLLKKFTKPWNRGVIGKAISRAEKEGRDPVISIPELNYKKKASEVLSEFVDQKFDAMVYEVSANGLGSYPHLLRSAIEKNATRK